MSSSTATVPAAAHRRKPFYTHLYVQVLAAVLVGVALGVAYPSLANEMKPLGDAFVKLIKMMIAPIVFTTVVVGIARMGDMKEVGRVGLKTLLYFEGVTTLALIIGLTVANLLRQGGGINAEPTALDRKAVSSSPDDCEARPGAAVMA